MSNCSPSCENTWIAASYHMPILYSCRSPISSPMTGVALPTPGPATIQLALVRVGVELFGVDYVRDRLFLHIISCHPVVQPSEWIAISDHFFKAFKADNKGYLVEAPSYRQMAHAEGEMIIYGEFPKAVAKDFRSVFSCIGYWGQSGSFSCCTKVEEHEPVLGSVMMPVDEVGIESRLETFFSAFTTELIPDRLSWEDLTANSTGLRSTLEQRLYVWPLRVSKHINSSILLEYCPLLHRQ